MTIADRVSKYNRERKWKLFKEKFQFDNKTTVLDVGFNNVEYSANDNFLEKVYPYPENITALGIEGSETFRTKYPDVNAINYDGYHFPFPDKSFDIVWSNAVLEHVGNWDREILFLKEIKRAGKVAFVTTPNLYFPVEVHTRTVLLHYLPQKIFHGYLRKIGKSWATGDYMNLLSRKRLVNLLNEADIQDYEIKSNRLFFFTLDFVITF